MSFEENIIPVSGVSSSVIIDAFATAVVIFGNYEGYAQAVKQLNKWSDAYYNKMPLVEDDVYDALYDKVKETEKQNPEWKLRISSELSKLSPVDSVGAKPTGKFEKITHSISVLSLSKVQQYRPFDVEKNAIREWLKKLYAVQKNETLNLVAESKIDGASIILTYEDGILVRAVTKGDSKIGSIVTENIKTIASIPQKIPVDGIAHLNHLPKRLEVRGEVFVSISNLALVNKELEQKKLPPLNNPRNAASGALQQLDAAVAAERRLDAYFFQAYDLDVMQPSPENQLHLFGDAPDVDKNYLPESLWATQETLQQWGFQINPVRKEISSEEQLYQFINDCEVQRHYWNFKTDGLVFTLNDTKLYATLGATAHHPNWAIAYKYPSAKVKTTLFSVDFSVGRTGNITPTANLAPVVIDNTEIRRASIHNVGILKQLDLHENDSVLIYKAGEIIPQVEGVLLSERKYNHIKPIVLPTHCPSCNTALEVKLEGEKIVNLICPNTAGCPAQLQTRLEHWVGKKCLDIDGLGGATLEQLVATGLVQSPADLYRLTPEQLLPLEGFAQKSAQKTVEAIQASISQSPVRVLHALGISSVGIETATVLLETFGSIDRLKEAKIEALQTVYGVGTIVAQAVVDYFAKPETQQLLADLTSVGFDFSVQAQLLSHAENAPLLGHTYVLTGTLASMTRDEAGERLKALGAKITNSVSKNTTALIAGEGGGSKLAKAEKLGIPVLDEAALLELLASKSNS